MLKNINEKENICESVTARITSIFITQKMHKFIVFLREVFEALFFH